MRVRFAPSPTGHLHVGNVRTALFNWLLARGHDGAFILRIEDTDVERSRAESDAMILEDLRWLGLDWDEGPEVGGPVGPYRSSERLEKYQSRARVLIEEGRAYYCFCTPEQLEAERKEALANNLPAKYSGRCAQLDPAESKRRVQAGERAAVRFRTPENREIEFNDLVRGDIRFHTDVIGDQVLLRSDGHPAYNFAVVVDDGLMGITHVVRGEDHISNTPRQILIYEALGLTVPAFGHVAMVLGPDHTKLSKRHGAVSVDEFREKGYLPEALLNYLALLSWSPGENQEILPIAEMAKRFSLSRRRPQRQRIRRREAGVGQPSLPEGCGSRATRTPVDAVPRALRLYHRRPDARRVGVSDEPRASVQHVGRSDRPGADCAYASCFSSHRPRRWTKTRFAAK